MAVEPDNNRTSYLGVCQRQILQKVASETLKVHEIMFDFFPPKKSFNPDIVYGTNLLFHVWGRFYSNKNFSEIRAERLFFSEKLLLLEDIFFHLKLKIFSVRNWGTEGVWVLPNKPTRTFF